MPTTIVCDRSVPAPAQSGGQGSGRGVDTVEDDSDSDAGSSSSSTSTSASEGASWGGVGIVAPSSTSTGPGPAEAADGEEADVADLLATLVGSTGDENATEPDLPTEAEARRQLQELAARRQVISSIAAKYAPRPVSDQVKTGPRATADTSNGISSEGAVVTASASSQKDENPACGLDGFSKVFDDIPMVGKSPVVVKEVLSSTASKYAVQAAGDSSEKSTEARRDDIASSAPIDGDVNVGDGKRASAKKTAEASSVAPKVTSAPVVAGPLVAPRPAVQGPAAPQNKQAAAAALSQLHSRLRECGANPTAGLASTSIGGLDTDDLIREIGARFGDFGDPVRKPAQPAATIASSDAVASSSVKESKPDGAAKSVDASGTEKSILSNTPAAGSPKAETKPTVAKTQEGVVKDTKATSAKAFVPPVRPASVEAAQGADTLKEAELWQQFLAGSDLPVGADALPPPELYYGTGARSS
eukprot:TRINITY_DN37035_c0_g1_i1.p1 TRINITY_DN37035_c0_g1~~TRINITY_DN37035_c0_g1_i1.p1  ORF type:complete len:521 (+),score=86.38 TRINITY_DN37035_c0_g1_i1:146-1564(+)